MNKHGARNRSVPEAGDTAATQGWVNFYRQDDVSATAYFYLDSPDHDLASLPAVPVRTAGLKGE